MSTPAFPIRARWQAIWRQPLLRLFLLAILAECLIGQWAAYLPMPTAPMDVPAAHWSLEGFTRAEENGRILTAGSGTSASPAVIIQLSDTAVRTLDLDAYTDGLGPLSYSVSVITGRNSAPRVLAGGETATGVARSRSLLLWPDSPVTRLRLAFSLEPGQRLFLNRLTVNRRIPFEPDSLRILLILAAGSLLHVLFTAPLFRRPALPDDLGQRLVTTAAGAIIVILCLWLAIAAADAPFFDVRETGDIYSRNLTDALLRGRFDLLTDPPPELARLANPYDPALRATVPVGDILWDASWYNGRYYVSYGVVPALLIFVPFRALSGYMFQTAWAVCLFGTFGTLLLFLNLRRLFLIHFPHLAFRWHLIANLAVCAASFTGWGLARPKFYELASLGGFFFLMLAASQLLRAVYGHQGAPRRSLVREAAMAAQPEDAKEAPLAEAAESPTWAARGTDRISGARLFLASLFLMLAIGCQPVQAIALLPYGIVLAGLLPRARRNRQVTETLFFSLLPLVAVGLMLGAYNQARFGSMFEFGGRYRLTVADLRSHGFSLARLFPGLGQHLLTPPIIDTVFPFIHFPQRLAFSPSTFLPGDGRAIGLLTLPVLAILPLLPLLPRLRQAYRASGRPLQVLLAGLAASGLVMAAYDSMTQGIFARSSVDFAVWLALAAALAWLMLAGAVDNQPFLATIHTEAASYPQTGEKPGLVPEQKRRPLPDAWFALFLAAAAITMMICALLFLQGESDWIRTYSPQFYEQLRRTIAFWLP